jgi:hypothetical protein
MRHSSIDLTMNTYTDPKLLDVYGALEALPALDLATSITAEPMPQRAAGIEDMASAMVAPTVAPNPGQMGQSVSIADIASADGDERSVPPRSPGNREKPSKKALSAGVANKASKVGMTGFEPATSTSRT